MRIRKIIRQYLGTMDQKSAFGESILKKYGWKEGKGLGRNESGISEALKVKLKFDNTGLGHDHSKQFTNHWWDHKFNKIAGNIKVNTSESGEVTVTHKEKSKTDKKSNGEKKQYGGFVKGSTLCGSTEIASSSDSSDSNDEKDADFSLKLTDEELFSICGGKTAHKGARHGLKMTAKLDRIEEQEKIYFDKMLKKNLGTNIEQESNIANKCQSIRSTHKKKKDKPEEIQEDSLNISNNGIILDKEFSDSTVLIPKHKKSKKKRHKDSEINNKTEQCMRNDTTLINQNDSHNTISRKKKNKDKNVSKTEGNEVVHNDEHKLKWKHKHSKCETDNDEDTKVKRKKRKHLKNENNPVNIFQENELEISSNALNRKKKKRRKLQEL